jgi:HEAT repeat protein
MTALETRIRAALAALGEDLRWELIGGILDECPDDVLAASRRLLSDARPRARTLGADIMGRLARVDPGARPALVAALLDRLTVERDPAAVASIVAALGHTSDPSPLPHVVALAGHDDAAVRLAVAFAVATIGPEPLPREARRALIRLSGDVEPEVRDWATFGLGTLSCDDGPDVRAALLARTQDSCRTARAEALFGLAVRRDPRAVPHLIRALESPAVDVLELDAAAEAADPRLLPALWALQRSGMADRARVRRAIDRCSGSEGRAPDA